MVIEVFEKQVRLDLLCNSIVSISNSIELVAILNHRGRVIEINPSHDTISKELSPQKREMFFMQCVLQSKMNKDHDNEFGRVKSSILERERHTVFYFELLDYVIVVIAAPVLEPFLLKNHISEKLAKIIELE